MSSALEKGLSVASFLAMRPDGASISEISQALGLPLSGVHRLLKELETLGYVRQVRDQGDYALSLKLATIGLTFLAQTGIPDLSQPILDRLAARSGELVRLALADGEDLAWVGVAQGATSGLRYDPGAEQGQVVHLASAAGGHAWLSAMSDEAAVAAVMRQGLERPGAGPAAPRKLDELMQAIARARAAGHAICTDSFIPGMAAIAMLIRHPDSGLPIGTVSIAGPAVRATPERLESMAPDLAAAAEELSQASRASRAFSRHFQAADTRRRA
ncbi:MAG: IclR family transcriptional regulator [Limimaricola soesokkakensis]|uniref:IclR family transcriptional regulator n=1 Tax=Limimaricola TaxID=2211638 RepID=UPI002AC9F12D|nr:IclR family transcriptional regulator [Limimaricola variabilis]WPY96907.1 IclR family transcriptional regulator [Limimaricola variabilis]